MKRVLTLLIVMSAILFAVSPALAENNNDAPDTMSMYAMLEDSPARELGPIASTMQRVAPFANPKAGGARPMLLWFHWANQRKPFVPSLLFLLFTSTLISCVIPNWMQNAQAACRERFWRTFFTGALCAVLAMATVRVALLTMLGWPLAVFLVGAYELALLAGLSVMVLLLGQSIGYYLKVDKWSSRSDVRRLACILIGAILCAALLQIPGFGLLPRIGTRLLAMLSVVGLGALYRTLRRA